MSKSLEDIMAVMGLACTDVKIDLLDIAIFGSHAKTVHKQQYPRLNGNKQLKFLGDRVLKLIHGEWIFRDLIVTDDTGIRKINPTLQSLEMNATFQCYLKEMGNVCKGIVHPRSRACANIFESVVGSIYMSNIDDSGIALGKVRAWLENHTPAAKHFVHLRTIDVPCTYCGGPNHDSS
jgi:dsRNA-specific ribonuclease